MQFGIHDQFCFACVILLILIFNLVVRLISKSSTLKDGLSMFSPHFDSKLLSIGLEVALHQLYI